MSLHVLCVGSLRDMHVIGVRVTCSGFGKMSMNTKLSFASQGAPTHESSPLIVTVHSHNISNNVTAITQIFYFEN